MNNAKIVEQKSRKLQSELNKLPRVAKNLGLQFFRSRFRAQGWLDESFTPWPKRKRETRKSKGRAILVKTGRLRNSISGVVNGGTITFGSAVPYAKVHNEGGSINRTGGSRVISHKRYARGPRKGKTLFHRNNAGATFSKKVTISSGSAQMPQRQFIGDSAHLRRVIQRKIQTTITNALK